MHIGKRLRKDCQRYRHVSTPIAGAQRLVDEGTVRSKRRDESFGVLAFSDFIAFRTICSFLVISVLSCEARLS